MCCKTPKVSIGIPVWNGEKYIREAIESALAQTYKDFELIISDNASTDRTEEICREYAQVDCRVRYYRNDQNLGISKNFRCVVDLAWGEYFKMLAADDAIEPLFIERCIPFLENDPEVVLVCSWYVEIDEQEDTICRRNCDHNLNFPEAHVRFRKLLTQGQVLPIFGLIRMCTLKQTNLIRPFIGTDFSMLTELAIKGKFVQVPAYLIRVRAHFDNYTMLKARTDGKQGRAETVRLDPASSRKRYLPHWRRLCEYFLAAIRSSETLRAKLIMVTFLIYPLAFKWTRWLGSELIYAVGLGPSYIKLKKIVSKLWHWH